jgi:hypothetical protein
MADDDDDVAVPPPGVVVTNESILPRRFVYGGCFPNFRRNPT